MVDFDVEVELFHVLVVDFLIVVGEEYCGLLWGLCKPEVGEFAWI